MLIFGPKNAPFTPFWAYMNLPQKIDSITLMCLLKPNFR